MEILADLSEPSLNQWVVAGHQPSGFLSSPTTESEDVETTVMWITDPGWPIASSDIPEQAF